MSGVNKVILVGRLGNNPELKYTPSGAAVCNLSVATSETWIDKNSGQKQEKTEWHRVIVWGKLGELCNQYLSKGRQVYVEGRIQTRSWDGTDGQKKYMTEINAATVQFLGQANNSTNSGSNQSNFNESDSRMMDEQAMPSMSSGSPAPSGSDGILNKNYTVQTDTNFTAENIPF